jgi:ceramide glucosyltransferase
MDPLWLTIYAVAAGLAIVQSLLVLLQTREHRRFARNRFCQIYRYRPKGKAMIYAPCKGVDIELQETLRRLLDQDYPNYEVTFIVESTWDPAYWLIRRTMAEHPQVETHLVIAGVAEDCGQKVHNLRVATAEIPRDVRYLAFIDSDAKPRRQWLRALISHLDIPRVGVATGYRWFVPVVPTLASHLIYSINCSAAIHLRSRDPNLVWGGSWALRRQVVESLNLREALAGMLTEDLVVADRIHRGQLRVEFEPACMVASPLEGSSRKLFSFLRRQYLLGRCYAPRWWRLGFATMLYANLVLAVSLALLGWGLAAHPLLACAAGGVCAAIYGLHVLRGLVRQSLILVYCPELAGTLRKAARFDVWAGPLVSAVSLAGLISSAIGRTSTWRGITYRLLPDGRTRILRRQPEPLGEPGEDEHDAVEDVAETARNDADDDSAARMVLRFRKAG